MECTYPQGVTLSDTDAIFCGAYVFSIINVELSNADAMNDPKTFQFGETSLDNPKGSVPETEDVDALVIYYNAVASYPGGAGLATVPNFDVNLEVSPAVSGVTWNKVDGPSSGSLVDASLAHAKYRNPKRGGLYEFDMDLASETTRTQLWLPVAGPDISNYWQGEINYFKTSWGPLYRTRLNERTVYLILKPVLRALLKRALAIADMDSIGGNLDWIGPVAGTDTPCGGPSGATGQEWRQTIHGVVIDFRKRNNMMYALIGREMGLPEFLLTLAADPLYNPFAIGAPDTAATRESYKAGYDLYDGVTLSDVMQSHGYGMQEPNSWAQKEWPSHEVSTSGPTRKAAADLSALIQ